VGAHAQALGHARPTAAAILAGVLSGDRHHPTPGACCLGFEDGPDLRPARSADALGAVALPHHSGAPQVFERDGGVVPQQWERRLVVEVAARARHRLMRPLEVAHRFAAALTALLATAEAP
jgi:hypothetical protein